MNDYNTIIQSLNNLGYIPTGFGGKWSNGTCTIQVDIIDNKVNIK